MADSTKPEVFLLSLFHQEFFDEMYSALIDDLYKSATVKRAKAAAPANRYLDSNNPKAVIVTDEALNKKTYHETLEKVVAYARRGGLVIIGLNYTSFTAFKEFPKLFQAFGLSWESGDYHRTTFQFNSNCALPTNASRDKLPEPYSMKALHVKNAQVNEKLYIPTPNAVTQSLVFPPEYVDHSQAGAAGVKVGDGYVAYIGDVNAEEGSKDMILALCGL